MTDTAETQAACAANPFPGAAPARSLDVPEPASACLTWSAGGEKIDYTATAAHLDVVSDAGKLLGRMFSLSYVAAGPDGEADPARPVTFAFNGGPGSSSVPINFGGLGPRRVVTDGCGHVRADAAVEDNPQTILRDTDVVFLDALGTGWSCVADDCEPASVFGVDGDADAFARAICAWLEENGRWSSPLYLFGESYGTIRNSVLMRILGERGVAVTGVVLLSAILDWVQVQPGEDLYYLGMMPTYAATAQWFGRAGKGVDVDEWFDRALEFTEDVLAPALLKGDRLDARREREIARKMSKFVGLAPEYLLAHHLRVDLADFRMALLADEGKICGRLDTRFASDALSPCRPRWSGSLARTPRPMPWSLSGPRPSAPSAARSWATAAPPATSPATTRRSAPSGTGATRSPAAPTRPRRPTWPWTLPWRCAATPRASWPSSVAATMPPPRSGTSSTT